MNKLHIKNVNDYETLHNNTFNESERREIYNQIITKQSKEAGYLNPADYLTDQKSGNTNQKNVELSIADSYDEMRIKATDEGFYSTDEAVFANAVDYWTPDQSAILRAHQEGHSLKTFNDYMHRFSAGLPRQRYYPGAKEQEEDIDHFKQDLVYAGYKPNAYTYTVNDHGLYEFTRNPNVPLERDPTQIVEVAMLRETGHSSELNEIIGTKSGNTLYNISELISNLSNKYLTMPMSVPMMSVNDRTFHNLSTSDAWTAYEGFIPTNNNVTTNETTNSFMNNLIQQETEKLQMNEIEIENENEDENAYLNDYNTDRELDSYANQLLAMKRRSNFRNTNDRAPDLTNEEIDRLEDGEQVTSEIDNSVYASM